MKIFDGHNDILNKISKYEDPLNTKAFLIEGKGHLDLPRALQGGFAGGFFAVYPSNPSSDPDLDENIILSDEGYRIPLSPELDHDYASNAVEKMIELLYLIEADSQGQFKVVTDFESLVNALEQNVMAAVFHLEGAEAISPDLSNFDDYYQRGLRSLGIVWSRPNQFGHGVPFVYPSGPDTGPGLTAAGKELVKKCNQRGVIIDLAHLNEKGFWDVAEISDAPLVSTHTAACSLVPKARNLTDEQIKAVGETNGVIGVIFSVNDLNGNTRPQKDAPISKIIDHISYIADLIGVEHVGFGSDFDGTTIPKELGDVAGFPKLVDLLSKEGFSPQEQKKICQDNWLRLLKETWKS